MEGVKLFKYRSAGVHESWIVDHAKNQIFVYYFDQDTMENYIFQDIVKVGIFEDLKINFKNI